MNESAKQLLMEEDELQFQRRYDDSTTRTSKRAIIGILLASNILCALGWASAILHTAQPCQALSSTIQAHHKAQPDHQIASVPTLPTRQVQFHWYTAYSSPNDTEADVLWNSINTAHGHVAVDHDIAAQHSWLPSMPIPGNESKGLYLLESYHQLHCLKIVRKLFFESQAGQALSLPVQHARHCFDAFRQFIMCHADNTPLYMLGQHTSGDGQWHMCNDWSALREYASEHTACFQDRVGNETLAEQFERCGDGTDGLLIDTEALDLNEIAPV